MTAKTDFAENQLIDHLFRGQALTLPASWHFALFTTNAGEAGGQTEVSGGSYARVAVARSLANFAGTQAAASTTASTGTSGTTSNNGAITFPAPTANWGTVTGVGIFDAATGGNLWFYNPLTTSRTVNSGDSAPLFPISSLTYQEDN